MLTVLSPFFRGFRILHFPALLSLRTPLDPVAVCRRGLRQSYSPFFPNVELSFGIFQCGRASEPTSVAPVSRLS